MLPKGNIWQSLRQQALGAIPIGSHISYRAYTSLAKWQAEGTYIVQLASPKRLTLYSSPVDIGGVLVSEAEALLDHATEHQTAIWQQVYSTGWTSHAWQVVTFYYWSYYLAMAITRMLGNTVWFIDKHVASQFSTLSATPQKVNPGTFKVHCGQNISVTEREILLHQSSYRSHDQLWKTWISIVDLKLSGYKKSSTNTLEERLYLSQSHVAKILNPEWPSLIRNLVNYRPGFAYGAVRKRHILDGFRYLNTSESYNHEDIIDRFETNAAALQRYLQLDEQAKLSCQLLVDMTFLLHSIATDLHAEIVERHKLDSRWLKERKKFISDQGLTDGTVSWPC